MLWTVACQAPVHGALQARIPLVSRGFYQGPPEQWYETGSSPSAPAARGGIRTGASSPRWRLQAQNLRTLDCEAAFCAPRGRPAPLLQAFCPRWPRPRGLLRPSFMSPPASCSLLEPKGALPGPVRGLPPPAQGPLAEASHVHRAGGR